MPLETKHTIHIFWSPWKISANTFITAERENMHRRGEDLLWVFCFCFSKKRSLPLPNSESYIVLICLQINQLTWIPAHLTHLLPVKVLLSPYLVFYICQDHRLSFSIVAWNLFHFLLVGIEMGDWQEVWDENTGCYYYWNTQTNEVTWELPQYLATQVQGLQHYQPR